MRSLLPEQYTCAKEQLREQLKTTETCAITTDFWSSSNTHSYITVTCHFINDLWELQSHILATYQVVMDHTAENIAAELKKITSEWGISEKISCIVTDNAANMVAAARLTGWRHLPCFAHTLNLIVQEATERDPVLSELRWKGRNIVTYFKQSIKARDKLTEVQKQMGGEEKKLIRDVITRWNSSYYMYERLVEEYKAINATLCFFDQSHFCLSSSEVAVMIDAIKLLKHFEQATREISAEFYLTISKVIPLARSLQYITNQCPSSLTLKQELLSSMARRFSNIEANYALAASTLLDPRFKKAGFGTACDQAVHRLTTEVSSTIDANQAQSTLEQQQQPCIEPSQSADLWQFIDESVAASQSRTSTANSIVLLKSYFEQPVLERKENPLRWWSDNQRSFPSLVSLVKRYLSIPATSVPSERLFSKAGEITSLKRNRLKSKSVDMILFLNKL